MSIKNIPQTAKPGDLDLSFGINGSGSTSVLGDTIVDIAVVKGEGPHKGKTVGLMQDDSVFKLFRLDKDGNLDMEFGSDVKEGKRTGYTTQGFDSEGSRSIPNKLTLIDDKKILVTGEIYSGPFNSYAAAALFNFSGSRNPVFGTNGVFILQVEPPTEEAPRIPSPEKTSPYTASTGDKKEGHIVFCLESSSVYLWWGLLIRLTPNGVLDTTFNGSGYVFFRHPGGASAAHSVVTQTDGTIIVAGSTLTEGFLAGFNPDGSIKRSFGSDGFITFKSDNGSIRPHRLLLRQADDALIVIGRITRNVIHAWVTRTLPNGKPDITFNGGEPLITEYDSVRTNWNGVDLDSKGAIIAAGTIQYLNFNLVGRITESGVADPTFGTDGYSDPYANGMPQLTNCVAVQTDSHILIGGKYWSSTVVSRLHA